MYFFPNVACSQTETLMYLTVHDKNYSSFLVSLLVHKMGAGGEGAMFNTSCVCICSFFSRLNHHNWMAWCKRDVSDFFRWNFFSFKSAWIFACAFQLSRKTFSCIVLWLKCSCSALLCSLCTLQHFVFVFLRNKVQTRQKKYRGMLYYLIKKHMKKFRHFWRKKNFTWKSHLRPSCTKPFNCCLSLFYWRFGETMSMYGLI